MVNQEPGGKTELQADSKLSHIDKAGWSNDGRFIMFHIVTKDGDSKPIWMAIEEMEHFISYLSSLYSSAAQQGNLPSPAESERLTTNPIEATKLGLAEGRTPQEIFLHVSFGTNGLTFCLPSKEILGLQHFLNQNVVSAGKGKTQ